MSAYTDATEAITAPVRFLHRLTETTGTTFADTGGGASPLALTKVGTPAMGDGSILPNDPSMNSVRNSAETPLAERLDNAILDRPSGGIGISVAVWCKPLVIEQAVSPLVSKAGVYQLMIEQTSLRFDLGANVLKSGGDIVTPNQSHFIVGTYATSGGAHKIYMNGVERATRTGSGAPAWSNATKLEIGGYTSSGSQGFNGNIQHVGIRYDKVLTPAEIQGLYQVGVATASEVNGQGANVFAWSRSVLAANANRTRARLTNDSDARIYLALGATATVGGGAVLYPGDYWETPKPGGPAFSPVYKGAFSAIIEAPSGVKRLAVVQE